MDLRKEVNRMAVYAEDGEPLTSVCGAQHDAVQNNAASNHCGSQLENTFSTRSTGGVRSLVTIQPLPLDVCHDRGGGGGFATPTKCAGGGVSCAVDVGKGGIKASRSPADSDDGGWDAELDDLLKWTDTLSPLAV